MLFAYCVVRAHSICDRLPPPLDSIYEGLNTGVAGCVITRPRTVGNGWKCWRQD